MAKPKFHFRTSANTLPGLSKALAKEWRYGLPSVQTVRVRGPGGTTILIRPDANGNIADARWGGLNPLWNDAWKLPTWTAELKCGYAMARKGATTAAIKKSCTRKRS